VNVQFLTNKTKELLLLTSINKDFSNSAALCFTETWLSEAIFGQHATSGGHPAVPSRSHFIP